MYCILIRLSGHVAFQLKRDYRKSVKEYYKVYALFVAGPDFLHYGKDILFVFFHQVLVEVRGGTRVHQVKVHAVYLNTMLQDVQQAAPGFRHLGVEVVHYGIFQLIPIHFAKRRHNVRLRILQELKQHIPVHCMETVKTGILADNIALLLLKVIHYKVLIFFFSKDQVHAGISFFPVTYSYIRDFL